MDTRAFLALAGEARQLRRRYHYAPHAQSSRRRYSRVIPSLTYLLSSPSLPGYTSLLSQFFEFLPEERNHSIPVAVCWRNALPDLIAIGLERSDHAWLSNL